MKWARLSRFEPVLFIVFAAVCTLLSARAFYDARHAALLHAEVARQAAPPESTAHMVPSVRWSAPLDDVFIHFDFARSLASGRFFEWAPGGGYSSGATSWLYPTILAVAYRLGATGFALGRFADWFACICVFGALWTLRRAYAQVAPWFGYVLCAALMSLGVFDWALWSGMEFALFLLLWCAGHWQYQRLCALPPGEKLVSSPAWQLGIIGLLLVSTRPEAILCHIVWFAFIRLQQRNRTPVELAKLAALVLAPALLLVLSRSLLNKILTGEFADAGSLVKLEPFAPFYNFWELSRIWAQNLGFQFGRITAYHAGNSALWGTLLWFLVVGALWLKFSRPYAAPLCVMAFSWMALVANNEYVRYQNDRYTVPALGWLVITAALCLVALIRKSQESSAWQRWALRAAVVGIALVWNWHQYPRFRQQKWLFGRACRNIAEQQIRLGLLLHATTQASHHRILVGDAGAIEYFSNLPGIDAIGLGGARGLPLARAVRLGVGAIVELIERLPPQQRPDIMALYPSWWKELPLWFGQPVLELPINGNVICGASSKVVYEAQWRGLNADSVPCTLHSGWRLVDELDVADLVSESAHSYHLSDRHSGYVFMKILPHPRDPSRDLFDAGRILFGGQKSAFTLQNLSAGSALRLVFRAAPAGAMRCTMSYDGRNLGTLRFEGKDTWQESNLDVSADQVKTTGNVEIMSTQGECNVFHIWALQPEL